MGKNRNTGKFYLYSSKNVHSYSNVLQNQSLEQKSKSRKTRKTRKTGMNLKKGVFDTYKTEGTFSKVEWFKKGVDGKVCQS